jgi:hypothetical protein
MGPMKITIIPSLSRPLIFETGGKIVKTLVQSTINCVLNYNVLLMP